MAAHFDLLVTNGTCMLPNELARTNIAIQDGLIVSLGPSADATADQVIDATGLHVLPGLIDSQVHFREPGLEHKEDLATGTAGAAMGGITAIFEMPNTRPSTTTQQAIEDKLARAQGRAWVDHAFYVGAAASNIAQLPELERLPGVSGVKIFMGASTGNLLVPDDETVGRVLASGTRRVAVHSEDNMRLQDRKHIAVEAGHPRAHPEWRDDISALQCTQRLLRLARNTGRPVHVLHVTTEQEMAFLKEQKALGTNCTVEATPQHLTLFAEDAYERLGTFAQMNPPIRSRRHRDALWAALTDGVVDVIGSDHAPHTREEKARPYPSSPSGMPGVQTLVPLMLNHVHQGKLSLRHFVDLVTTGPVRALGVVGKGAIVTGNDGDLTLVDLAATREITHEWMASRCGWTPFDGMRVTGWPMATVVRGNIVMRDGELMGPPLGAPIRFQG